MTVPGLAHRRVIVVGSGHAGLSVAAELVRSGLHPQRDVAVIDSNSDGRRSWASRWSEMELLTEAGRSPVAGRHLAGDPYRRPLPRDIEQHLLEVETALGITTMWGIRATGVDRLGDGSTLVLSTNEGPIQTRNIVCATGSAGRPRVPGWAVEIGVPGVVLHSADYHGPNQIPTGDVLIIGSGHSGQQIARDLSSSHRVTLSSRNHRRDVPRRAGARGRFARKRGVAPAIQGATGESLDIEVMPAAVAADGTDIVFADGQRKRPESIIFATGYLPADGWLPSQVLDGATGRSRRGTTDLPGLFVAGIPRHSRADADTFDGARRDAISIARRIMTRP